MDYPTEKKFTFEKSLVYILIAAGVIVFGFIIYLFFFFGGKSVKIISPNGFEEWQIGEKYKITWQAKKISKVGIVLFKENEPEWIAKDVDAKSGQYEWEIYPGHKYGGGFWIAVFEYPYKNGNAIDYSNSSFAITYPELSGCEDLSIKNERPYLPSDFPGLRRVFITKGNYKGNLGGLEGADKICQQEADTQSIGGAWFAFIGGDNNNETAVNRIENTPDESKGIFAEAIPEAVLLRGATCHRLLGKDFNDFLSKFSSSVLNNKEKLGDSFSSNLKNIWIGRLNQNSKSSCIPIAELLGDYYTPLAEKYSFTATCQNWTKSENLVENSSSSALPACYTAEGKKTGAAGLAGLAIYEGKSCDKEQKLICIEK